MGNPNAVMAGVPNTDLGKDDLDRTDKKFTPKVGLGWKIAPEHNVYATWSKGFKGGMFDPRMDLGGKPTSTTALAKRKGVAPEEVSSVELGLKSSMNGGRLQTNAAVFYTDYKNVQIPGSIATYDANGNVNGFAGTLTNAGKAKISGLELEGIAYLTNALSVSAMYSHINAKYKEWMVSNATGTGLVNIAGSTEFQNTPKNAANLSVNYDWPLALMGRAGTLSLMNSVAYKSKVYQTEIARPTGVPTLDVTVPGNLMLAQGGYGLWDAGLVWTSADRKYQVGLHGRNLLDKRYKVAGYNFSTFFNSVTTFYGDPRTVRATLDVKF
jgi:iron complex outermembrane receptor protein